MPLFGLFGVWFLLFCTVQSKLPPKNGLVSDVDVKSLMQRLKFLEESLKAEKDRNDKLEKAVNSLVRNLKQTKQTFQDKWASLEKQLQKHPNFRPIDFFNVHQSTVDKFQKKGPYKKRQNIQIIDWWKPWKSLSKNQDSNTALSVTQRSSSMGSKERLLVQPRQITPTTVAFYAYMSLSNLHSETTGNHILVFDVVKTNAGNGYHPSTGIFVVPESGIYVFFWSFRNVYGQSLHTSLAVNNYIEGTINLDTDALTSVTGTGLAVLHVNKGDDVYLQISKYPGTIYSDPIGRSSFAGWKLN